MDAKLTLHFDQEVIIKAKAFAAANNISLSRLTEFIYRSITSGDYVSLEELPIADWVSRVAEGEPQYLRRTRKQTRTDYYNSRK
jgi:hypothetical protein